MKYTYVLGESSGFWVPVVTVPLDSESVVVSGGSEETLVVDVAANSGRHKINNCGYGRFFFELESNCIIGNLTDSLSYNYDT